jgi:hypothetical protein
LGHQRKFIESNENENSIYQNLWDTEKAVIKGKFITISAKIFLKSEKSQINNLKMYLGLLLHTQIQQVERNNKDQN